MLSRSLTRARSFMRPPQWATGAAKPRGAGGGRAGPRVSTGKPRVKRINWAPGQYRQRGPVRAGLAGGLVYACGADTPRTIIAREVLLRKVRQVMEDQ